MKVIMMTTAYHSNANENSANIMSVAYVTDFLYKVKQSAKYHGKISLLGQ